MSVCSVFNTLMTLAQTLSLFVSASPAFYFGDLFYILDLGEISLLAKNNLI